MSSRKLREKPRVCYYEPEEPSLDEYIFCERCSDYVYEYCAVHGPLLVIPDDKVPSKPNFPSFVPRAALTIPHVFLHLARSIIPGAGVGVFSTLTLPRGVRFGPYRGLRSTSVDSMYCWQIYDRNNKRSHVVDAADANRSNWMRYVNCSRHWSEQNLVAYQYKGQLYYRTIKPVPRFTELLVFYGGEFARALRVRLPAYNAPRAYAAKFGAPIPKKPRLVTPKIHKETSIKKLKKSDQRKDRIEQPKSETNRTVEDIPAHKSKIVETRDELNSNKENTNTSDHSDVHKELYVNKVSADQSIKSNVSQKLTPYSCDTCQTCFTAKSSLARHIRTHTGEKQFKCSICKKCFNQKTNLATHIRTHTGEKPFKCSICKKCFNTKTNLARHIRTHTGEKPFKCSICKKCFNTKTNLDSHIRTHTGEKPFKCSICKKCFSQKSDLARHIRTHTGEKPFKCSICKKCFSRKSYLKSHSRTHTAHIV